MGNIISISKLTYRYNDDFIFHNFDLDIKQGAWLTIAGPNASGKSTLVKILTGLIITDNNITINDRLLSKDNLYFIRKNMGVVFENPDNSFICETVRDDIALILENLSYPKNEINKSILEISKILKIDNILSYDPHNLSGGEKQKVALACALVHNPKILILDEALSMIDEKSRNEILETLNKIHKEKNITIINVTHNLSESFYSNRLVIINKGEIILDGLPKKVMMYDRILNKIGIELPFVVDLSIKLKLYGLIDEINFDMNEMVDILWK